MSVCLRKNLRGCALIRPSYAAGNARDTVCLYIGCILAAGSPTIFLRMLKLESVIYV